MVVAHKVIAAHKTTGTAECLRRRPGTLPSWRGSMFTRPPIDSLVNELLALVLEQLLETADFGSRTNSGPSWTCRLVSRRFYAVATPLCYRELKLTDGIVASAVAPNVVDHDEWDVDLESSAIYQGRTASRGLANIFTYTEHVLAGSDLDVRGVKAVLRGATKLTTVTWHYTGAQFRVGRRWMPSSLLEMVDRQRARRRRHEEEAASGSTPSRLLPPLQPVRLIVENLPLCDFENAGLGNGGPSESFTSYSPSIDNAYLHAIPADALVSLRMAPPLPPMTNKLGGLKQLLLAARGLRTFHFQDRGQGTRFHFGREIEEEMEDAEADHMDEDYDSGLDSDESDLDFDEYAGNSPGRSSHETARRPLPRSSRQHLYHDRLPAFHDLSLRSYDWNHSPAVVARHWDLTQLRRLSLTSMPTHAFLSSVSLSQVGRHLRSLTLDDYSAHLPVDRRSEATALLAELLAVHVPMGQLEELRVTVRDAPSFPLRECIVRHADSLKVLAFRDHVGFRPDAGGGCGGAAGCGQVACPTLRARDVAMLAAAMRRVETLELDMDVAACDDVYAFQQAVASFPAVRDATLHVQTCLRPMGPELEEETGPLVAPRWPQEGYVGGSDGRGSSFGRSGPLWPPVDRDRDEAAGTFARLREFKRAAMVKAEARDEAVPPWRSITINVGGWSKIMVRRFGEGWRRHNERGLYAERCFTMNAAGEMSEEKSIES